MPGCNKTRDRKLYTSSMNVKVQKSFTKLGLISFQGYLEKNENNENRLIIFAPYDTPLYDYFQQDCVLKEMTLACEQTISTMYAEERQEYFERGVKRGRGILEGDVEKGKIERKFTAKLLKPREPIFSPTFVLDFEKFFPLFIRSVYNVEKLEVKNLWAKIDKISGYVDPPTPPCPNWDNNIIDPIHFFGMGRKYSFGNLYSRLRLQVANIMMAYGKDPDLFAESIPHDYVPRRFVKDDLKFIENGLLNNKSMKPVEKSFRTDKSNGNGELKHDYPEQHFTESQENDKETFYGEKHPSKKGKHFAEKMNVDSEYRHPEQHFTESRENDKDTFYQEKHPYNKGKHFAEKISVDSEYRHPEQHFTESQENDKDTFYQEKHPYNKGKHFAEKLNVDSEYRHPEQHFTESQENDKDTFYQEKHPSNKGKYFAEKMNVDSEYRHPPPSDSSNNCIIKQENETKEEIYFIRSDKKLQVYKCSECNSRLDNNSQIFKCLNCKREAHVECANQKYSNSQLFVCTTCTLENNKVMEINKTLMMENINLTQSSTEILMEVDNDENENQARASPSCDKNVNAELQIFLRELNMSHYLSLFTEEKLDIGILKHMTHSDLQTVGVKAFGDRYRIIDKCKQKTGAI